MADEATIQAELVARFPYLQDKVRIQRARRIWVEVPAEHVVTVFNSLVKDLGFTILCTITGFDLGANLGATYHLARVSGEVLNLAVAVPKERPVLQTVTGTFPAADCYERELVDLLGFDVQGLKPGSRYPLPDGWPAGQFPLRKDWKASEQKPYDKVTNEVPNA